MTVTVASIVEGHGEVAALPLLLRRIGEWKTPETYVKVLPPSRVHRDRFINRDEEFERHVKFAADKCGESGWVLIVLDADDDCPVRLGADILQRAEACVPHSHISVVLANREYEAWFIAAAQSLDGQRGFCFKPTQTVDAETPRNAKGWIGQHMGPKGYGEVLDQPAFSATMDLRQAFDGSRSFRKLCSEWTQQVDRLTSNNKSK